MTVTDVHLVVEGMGLISATETNWISSRVVSCTILGSPFPILNRETIAWAKVDSGILVNRLTNSSTPFSHSFSAVHRMSRFEWWFAPMILYETSLQCMWQDQVVSPIILPIIDTWYFWRREHDPQQLQVGSSSYHIVPTLSDLCMWTIWLLTFVQR